MKHKKRKLIVGTVAVTALGVGGASVAASGSEQTGSANNEAVVAAVKPTAVNVVAPHVVTADTPSNATSAAEAEPEGSISGDDALESEVPITGTDLDKAAAVALAYTGGGRVTETEVGDEESYYEVEVRLDDGSQVDVQLDENFKVVGSESEGTDGD